MEIAIVLAEMWVQSELAVPLIMSNLCQFLLQIISLMFVGHLQGELALAGASMATCFAAVTGFSVLMGLGSALDTMCGQAYGAKHYPMLGIYMQRAALVLTLVSIPISFLWGYTDQILIVIFHEDEQISAVAGLYARWTIPALFGYAILQCHIRFLQTQNMALPLMLTSAMTVVLHIVLCWSLVFKIGLGTIGAALATSISYWFNVFVLALLVNFSPEFYATWTGFSREAFHDVFEFIKLAIPSAAMICLEFWAFGSLVPLAGRIPNAMLETSVMSTSLSTCAVVFMISLGLGTAISARVANEMGAGNPRAVCLAVRVAAFMAIIEGFIVGSIMIFVRNFWGEAYSDDAEVARTLASMMPLIALLHFVGGTQSVFSGTARGCGWQKMGTFINIGCYYIVGIPCSTLLAFGLHIGRQGLWIGMIFALALQDLVYLIIMLCTNWDTEVQKATEKLARVTIPIQSGAPVTLMYARGMGMGRGGSFDD